MSFTGETPASAATTSNVSSATSSTLLAAANAARRQLMIVNDSTAILYVKLGSAATSSSYSYKLAAGDTLELPKPIYRGLIHGIWASVDGAARVTEY